MSTNPLIKRLQPLLSGVQKAEDFIQELLCDSLEDCVQRISISEKIPVERLRKHSQPVLEGMKIRIREPTPMAHVICRGKTKKKLRCKRKAIDLSEFCAIHKQQRQAHEADAIVRRQLIIHDAKKRASKLPGHIHIWQGDFEAECAVCASCIPPEQAVSYSGQSFQPAETASQSGAEVSSKRP